MNTPKHSPEVPQLEELLAQADSKKSQGEAADSTIHNLLGELETMADELRQPIAADPFQNESACVEATEKARDIGTHKEAHSSAGQSVSEEAAVADRIGPYKLLKMLGQGGMGAVYKALHPKLDKVVALKVLTSCRLKNAEAINRFEREMKAVGKLDHPHLIRALDAGEADGSHYLVMEYVDGTDLAALIKDHGPLPIAEACELIIQAASGLQAAHTRGMVHRDIKPANLMLAQQEFGPPVVKVLDLGLALLADADPVEAGGLTSDGQIMGTIDYMAPEQANDSHSVDIRADIYSLGATLYALLTGGSLFQTKPHLSLMQKLTALATESVPPIRERRADISKGLADVVHRMLSKKPTDRFATPADVITALKPFAVGANLASFGSGTGTDTSGISTNVDSYGGTVMLVSSQQMTPTIQIPQLNSNASTASGRPWKMILLAASAAVALLAVILLTLKTPHGEVIVEIPDDLPAEVRKEIKISVTGDGAAEVANEANGWKVGIKEGKYGVELTGGQDRVQIEDKQVTVSRNKKAIVTITMKPTGTTTAADASEKPKPAGATTADPANDRRVAEWVLGINGEVTVRKPNGESVQVKELKLLPQEPFTLTGLHLGTGGNYRASQISKDDCRKFAALSGLELLDVGRQPITTEGLAHFSGCRELKALHLYDNQIGVDAIPIVTKFTKLELFQFQSHDCDTWAQGLSKMPSLRTIVAYRCGITDAGVAHLARLPKLEYLNLVDADLTDASLKSLATCKSLKSLSLHSSKLTWPEVRRLQQALPECKIDDARLTEYSPDYKFAMWLKSLPAPLMFEVTLADGRAQRIEPTQPLPVEPLRVHYLFLQGPAFDQPGDAFLDEFEKHVKGQRITGLHLRSPTLTSERVARLAKLPELSDVSVVSLTSELIDDKAIEALASFPKLTHAVLRCPKLTGKGLSRWSELIYLAMNDPSSVTPEGIEELAQLPKLGVLQISGFPFTERHIDAMAKLKLKNLQTYEAGIDDTSLARLSKMEKLETLLLNKSPITDAGLPELKKLKSLTHLSLVGTKVTAAGVAELQKALPSCKIEWDAPDSDRLATEWLLSLKHPPKLDLGKDGNPWLTLQPGQALPADKFHLYFIQFDKPEHEALGDEFVDELAKHLSGSKQLARFQFPGRKLTAAGLAKLVRLPELADVQDLQISPETMDDAMVAELAALKKLIHLSISRASNISGKNFGLLKGLVTLHLMECPNLTPEGLEELQPLPLELLHIGNLRLTEKHVTAIAGLKKLHRLHSQGIDDSTVAGLANMESLFWLGFENSQITDKGLQELKNFKGLKTTSGNPVISLGGSKVTAAGVAELQKALPNCKIE